MKKGRKNWGRSNNNKNSDGTNRGKKNNMKDLNLNTSIIILTTNCQNATNKKQTVRLD
jgi:hypothetical protein